jgi:menaquinone-dependent protoporphyrinogen oxidase
VNILVAAASRHGSTREIGEAIAGELKSLGHRAIVSDAALVEDSDDFDAYIIGSAVYMGRWLPDARALVKEHGASFLGKPVWLFSSGPLGEPNAQPKADPAHLEELMQATAAREHRMFVGKLEKHGLGPGERIAVKMVKAPEGDFRDWESIRGWAREIALELEGSVAGAV